MAVGERRTDWSGNWLAEDLKSGYESKAEIIRGYVFLGVASNKKFADNKGTIVGKTIKEIALWLGKDPMQIYCRPCRHALPGLTPEMSREEFYEVYEMLPVATNEKSR